MLNKIKKLLRIFFEEENVFFIGSSDKLPEPLTKEEASTSDTYVAYYGLIWSMGGEWGLMPQGWGMLEGWEGVGEWVGHGKPS